MSDPTSNVKIYDRPERKMPSALVLLLIVLVAAVGCFFVYRAMHPASPSANTPPGVLVTPAVVRLVERSQGPKHTSESLAAAM